MLAPVGALLLLRWAVPAAASSGPNGVPWPPTFDCEMRVLGYRMSQWLQPERNWTGSGAKAVAAGLKLNAEDPLHTCAHRVPAAASLRTQASSSTSWPTEYAEPGFWKPKHQPPRSRGWRAGVEPIDVAAAVESTLYVDPNSGDDSATGSQEAALKTIAAAVARVPSLPAPRSVVLRGGTHLLESTLILGEEHSQTSLSAADGEEAVVAGSAELRPSWVRVSEQPNPKGAVIYSAPLPPGADDFLELFAASGERLVPAREPDGNPEADQSNYRLRAAAWLPNRDFGKATVVANRSWTRPGVSWKSYAVGVGGPANNFDPPVSMWADLSVIKQAGGGELYSIPSGMRVDDQHGGAGLDPSLAAEGFVFMMHPRNWASWVYEINATALSNDGSIEVHFGRGGQQEARGNGGAGGGGFYFSHRREFLDAPGEWYLDRSARTLYVAVAGDAQPPPVVFAPVVQELVRIEGTQSAPASAIRLSGLTFRHSSPTFMADWTVPSGGDYAVHRGGAIHFVGTADCMIDHSLLEGLGGNGIWLSDFNRGAQVVANELRFLGENGIGMSGSTEWVDGRGGDQPRRNQIVGNLVHHLGLYTKQSTALFFAVACQNLIAANIFFHSPRHLINMNDGFGGETIIKQNVLFGSMLETSDGGPLNSWDRLPYITTVRDGTPSLVPAYNTIAQNLFFSGGGEAPFSIDTDDGTNQLNATQNVLLWSALWKTDFGGHTKSYTDNVVFCNENWAHCGTNVEMDDASNVLTRNRIVGHGSLYTCSNSTNPCPVPAGGAHSGKPGNSTACPLVGRNEYYIQTDTSSPVCPDDSQVEQGSMVYPLPELPALLRMSEEALGMSRREIDLHQIVV